MKYVSAVVVACVLALMIITPARTGAQGGAVLVPRYVDETRKSGIKHVYQGDFAYYTSGGVAAFDCDGDGLDELYFAGGSGPAALYHNDSKVGGALRFSRIKDPATDLVSVTGAYPLDIDGDGVTDLAVLRYGENILLRGLGGCRFERANEAWSFSGGDAWTTAFSATWEGDAVLPTLAIGNYVDESGTQPCLDDQLVRPATSGSGYAPAVALQPSWCALSMLFSDWDRSGRADLRISNDRQYYPADEGQEQLWRVAAGEAPHAYTQDEGWQRLQLNGMGIASYDLNGDGYPEVYLSSQGPNSLQTLAAGPSQPDYQDITISRGILATNPTGDKSLPSTSWHDEFADVNNDGLIDLFVAKGNIDEMPSFAMKDPNALFLGQPDGTFVDEAKAAGVLSNARGRGAALVDLNLDGLLDLVVSNRRANAEVWRNVGSGTANHPAPTGDWLALQLNQPGPNRDAVGALVEVKVGDHTMSRELTVGGGQAGGQLGWIHFGLGQTDGTVSPAVRVQWPDMTWGPWLPVTANTFMTIDRASNQAQPWSPPPG
jgi:hypothetical protein